MARKHDNRGGSSTLRKINNCTAIVIALGGFVAAIQSSSAILSSLPSMLDVVDRIGEALYGTASQSVELEVSGEAFAKDPGDAVIKAAVLLAAARAQNAAFLVLARSADDFIQAANGDAGWDLEVRPKWDGRAGSSPLLFQCRKSVGAQVVITAFQRYRSGGNDWADVCAWTRVKS